MFHSSEAVLYTPTTAGSSTRNNKVVSLPWPAGLRGVVRSSSCPLLAATHSTIFGCLVGAMQLPCRPDHQPCAGPASASAARHTRVILRPDLTGRWAAFAQGFPFSNVKHVHAVHSAARPLSGYTHVSLVAHGQAGEAFKAGAYSRADASAALALQQSGRDGMSELYIKG